MVTFHLLGNYGELGNQLFQIAAASVLAKQNNTNAVFPEWVCGKSARKYSPILKNPLDETLITNNNYISGTWHEPGHNYTPIQFQDNISLVGQFQSEKYFGELKDWVRDDLLCFADYINDYVDEKYQDIVSDETIAVHIRSQTRSAHDAPSIHLAPTHKYLQEAFKHFGSGKKYAVFSDNIPLMKKMFDGYGFTFVEEGAAFDNSNLAAIKARTPADIKNNPLFDNVVEMCTMSKCSHAITTSSTFGWWGAWLIKNPDKKVIAMHEDDWFGPSLDHLNLSDLIPETWTKIKS